MNLPLWKWPVWLMTALNRSPQGKWSKSTCGGCSSVKPPQLWWPKVLTFWVSIRFRGCDLVHAFLLWTQELLHKIIDDPTDYYGIPNKSHSTGQYKNFDSLVISPHVNVSHLDPENCQKVNLFSFPYNKYDSYSSLVIRISSPNFGLPKEGLSKLDPGGPLSCAVSEISP